MAATDRDRSSAVALLACAMISAAPLFAGRYLPFADLPEHVATMASLRHWSDPEWRIAEHYTLAFDRSQYLLYHLVGAALSFVLGTAERANLALLGTVAIAYPFATRSLLRAFGRDERLAVLACPLFWSQALVVGLLPFVASVPLVLFSLGVAVRQAREPTRKRFVGLALLSLVLFFLHVDSLLLFALAAIVLTRSRRVAWLAPSVMLFAVWLARATVGLKGGSLLESGQIEFARPLVLARAFASWSHDIWRTHVDEVLGCAFWLIVAAIAIDGIRRRAFKVSLSHWAPVACTVLLYAILPFRVGVGDSINVRLGIFIPLFALLTLDLGGDRTKRMAFAGGVVLTLASALNNFYEVRAAQEEVGDLDRVLSPMPMGARVVSLDFLIESKETHFPAWAHAAAYHRAWKGGVSAPSFSALGHWPVQFRPATAPPAKRVDFWEFRPCLFDNAIDGAYYDYVLVRGSPDLFREHPPGPRWNAIVQEKQWTLFAKADASEPPRSAPVAQLVPCVVRR